MLTIHDPEAARLARQLAERTGETVTQAVIIALRERLAREECRQDNQAVLFDELLAIAQHAASLPVLDDRPADEILGYDANGLPT